MTTIHFASTSTNAATNSATLFPQDIWDIANDVSNMAWAGDTRRAASVLDDLVAECHELCHAALAAAHADPDDAARWSAWNQYREARDYALWVQAQLAKHESLHFHLDMGEVLHREAELPPVTPEPADPTPVGDCLVLLQPFFLTLAFVLCDWLGLDDPLTWARLPLRLYGLACRARLGWQRAWEHAKTVAWHARRAVTPTADQARRANLLVAGLLAGVLEKFS